MAKKPHLEVVTWLDHVVHYGDNQDPKQARLVKRESAGWVIGDIKDAIVLAHTKDEDSWADMLVIAKALITKRRRVN